jgi:flavin reductase (DIM6/NTAB) family NADH-FMN oxidoreductase RutF
MSMTHLSVEPAILYLGTPVVLVSSINEDGSPNLAPMSSAFWLGWRCMLGFEAVSKTPKNIVRTGECVLNLPSMDQVDAINRLSMVTGSNPVPPARPCVVTGIMLTSLGSPASRRWRPRPLPRPVPWSVPSNSRPNLCASIL